MNIGNINFIMFVNKPSAGVRQSFLLFILAFVAVRQLKLLRESSFERSSGRKKVKHSNSAIISQEVCARYTSVSPFHIDCADLQKVATSNVLWIVVCYVIRPIRLTMRTSAKWAGRIIAVLISRMQRLKPMG